MDEREMERRIALETARREIVLFKARMDEELRRHADEVRRIQRLIDDAEARLRDLEADNGN